MLGEAHAFERLKNQTIDYQLGTDIYLQSSEIWTEFDGTDHGGRNSPIPLTALLNPNTWDRFASDVKDSHNKMMQKFGQGPDRFIVNLIQEIGQADMNSALEVIFLMTKYMERVNVPDLKAALGLGAYLKKVEKASFEKKRFYVEGVEAGQMTWAKNCSGKDKAETFINAALDELETAKTQYAVFSPKWQDVFLKNGASVEEFEDAYLETTYGKISFECSVTPRNHLWLPKFKERLETKGDPVTFLVGMSHIGGSEGLLSLLRKEGYTNIKRIYAFE